MAVTHHFEASHDQREKRAGSGKAVIMGALTLLAAGGGLFAWSASNKAPSSQQIEQTAPATPAPVATYEAPATAETPQTLFVPGDEYIARLRAGTLHQRDCYYDVRGNVSGYVCRVS